MRTLSIQNSNVSNSYLSMSCVSNVHLGNKLLLIVLLVAIRAFNEIKICFTIESCSEERDDCFCSCDLVGFRLRTQVRILDLSTDDAFPICITHQARDVCQ